MCGITGFWTDGMRGDQARAALLRMTDSISHRGPDDSGSWFDEACGIALGHRRLSIVDLSPLGHQPMASASARYTIVYNGEIYNFRALRAELARTGMTFRGGSDTEVLLALVERHGLADALVRCTGMFAIALWDSQERTLQLARDRFGEKPLYHARVGDGMAFGSELTPVRRAPGFVGSIDRDAVAAFLRHGYINAPGAIFSEVRKLPPGCIATYTNARGTPIITQYWSLETVAQAGADNPSTACDEESLDALERLLGDAVGDQMVADVPLGAFLSGGVDSSLVVALMQKRATQPVRTFTIGFEDKAFDEAAHAEAVARHLGTEHTTMYVRAQDALELIPRLPDIYDEPFADSSQIPTALVASLARQHVTVALSGDGGDELFGGYSRYGGTIEIWKRLRHLPPSVRRVAADAVASVEAGRWDRALRPLGRLSRGITGDRMHKLADLFGSRDSAVLYRDIVSAWRDPGKVVKGARDCAGAFDISLNHHAGLLGEMMLRDQLTYLPGDILVKVDRAAMAASLESRAPLLDHRIAEFAWRLPRDQWLRAGRGKWIMRALLDRYVPSALVDRPKQGFGVPYADWLRGPLRDWADDLLSEDSLRRDGVFEHGPIVQRWQEHRNGTRNWAPALWSVLMFQAWRNRST